MKCREIDELLLGAVFQKPGELMEAARKFADWFSSVRHGSVSSDILQLCEFAVERLLHSSEHFSAHFQDQSTWWSAASLFHTSAQAGLMVESSQTLTLANCAWRKLCAVMGMSTPLPGWSEDSQVVDDKLEFQDRLSSLGDAAIPTGLIASDVLRVRSQAYALGKSRKSLQYAHNDLHVAMALLESVERYHSNDILQAQQGLVDVPIKPVTPVDTVMQRFVLSDSAASEDPTQALLGQKVILMRELAFVEGRLTILGLLKSEWETGTRHLEQ